MEIRLDSRFEPRHSFITIRDIMISVNFFPRTNSDYNFFPVFVFYC